MSAPIEIDNLGVFYDRKRVVGGFSLSMSVGEKVTLTGSSGSGKSTVLKCLLGLVVHQEGVIKIFGKTLDAQAIWEIRRSLAYVAQESDLGSGRAREALERPFSYKANVALRANLDRLPSLLDRFNLPFSLLEEDMSTLSGGEKQRVALVSAILLDRPVVLLDEASSALDKTNKKALADYFNEAKDLTVLSVSHDAEWLGFSNRVVRMAGNADLKGGDA